MAAAAPRTKSAQQRRAELLDAAEILIAENGADKLTVDAITTRAGVAKGTFYVQFSSKDDVLEALGDRLALEILVTHAAALSAIDPQDHTARLDRWIADAINGRVQRAELRDALFLRRRACGSLPADAHVRMLEELLQAGVDDNAFAICDVNATATLLIGAIHGGVETLLDGGAATTQRLVSATQELARRAAGAAPTG